MKQLYGLFFRKKRKISIILVLALSLGSFPANVKEVAKVKAAGSKYGINNPHTDSNGLTTWDCVYFGNYRQNDTNGDGIANWEDDKEPIKWRVLSVNGDDAFLLADQNLDYKEYGVTVLEEPDIYYMLDYDKIMTTWESCTLRNWLNEEFYNDAFSVEEQAAVRPTEVVNKDNFEYGTEGGNNTRDKVYLLSFDEVMNPSYGFPLDIDATETRAALHKPFSTPLPTPTASSGKKQTTAVTPKPTGASTAAVWPEVKFTKVNIEVQEMKKT